MKLNLIVRWVGCLIVYVFCLGCGFGLMQAGDESVGAFIVGWLLTLASVWAILHLPRLDYEDVGDG